MNPAVVGPLAVRSLTKSMPTMCDICGFRRGGTPKVDHSKCSEIRAAHYREVAKNEKR